MLNLLVEVAAAIACPEGFEQKYIRVCSYYDTFYNRTISRLLPDADSCLFPGSDKEKESEREYLLPSCSKRKD